MIDGGGGSNNVLKLSAGSHSLTTNANLQNIKTIDAHASGSTLDLTNQTENYTINGAGSVDDITEVVQCIITGKAGDDTLKGGSGNDTFNVDLEQIALLT